KKSENIGYSNYIEKRNFIDNQKEKGEEIIKSNTGEELKKLKNFNNNLIKYKDISIAKGDWFDKYLKLAINIDITTQNKVLNIIEAISILGKDDKKLMLDFDEFTEDGLNINNLDKFTEKFEIYTISFNKIQTDKDKIQTDKDKIQTDKDKIQTDKDNEKNEKK
ncbi:hypothetical protein KAZ01_03825, partial [Candidatus Gracilibacteria bacterium]|nr:hypothetical protein [Candidatus Gracilibacteria bacterium]